MKKILAAALCAALVATVANAGDEWIMVGRTERITTYIRMSSIQRSRNTANEPVVVALFRWNWKTDGQIDVHKEYVRDVDCEAGYGMLQVVDVDGSPVLQTAYASNAGSIASSHADLLCEALRRLRASGV